MIPVDVVKRNDKGKLTRADLEFSPIKSIRRRGTKLIFYDGDTTATAVEYDDIIDKHGTNNAQELLDFYIDNDYFSTGGGATPPFAQEDITGLVSRFEALENKLEVCIWYEQVTITSTSDGATGTITAPPNGTILEDGWGTGVTGIIVKNKNGRPVSEAVLDTDPLTSESFVVVSLNAGGSYTIMGQLLSGSPSVDAAIVYKYTTTELNKDVSFDLKSLGVFEPAVEENVAINTNQIADNTSDIATNTSDISTNSSAIAIIQNELAKITPFPSLDGAHIPVFNSGTATWEKVQIESLVHQYTAPQAPQTTTSTVFTDVVNENTPSLEIGSYVLYIDYSWNKNSTTNDFISRLRFDSVFVTAAAFDELQRQEPKDAAGTGGPTGSDQKHNFGRKRFDITVTTQGVKPTILDFASSNAGNLTSIWLVQMQLYKLVS